MKFKRLASTLAAAAIAGGGALTAFAAPAHADDGWGHDRHGRHGHFIGHGHGHAGAARLCVARSHKKYVKKRGGGKFGRYFGKGRGHYVVKKVATRVVKCGAWAQHRHNHFNHKHFGHKKFDKFGFGHKGFGHKGFGFDKLSWGSDDWGW